MHVPIYSCQREFFFSGVICGKPRDCHAHISHEKNLIKVKKLSTQTLGNTNFVSFLVHKLYESGFNYMTMSYFFHRSFSEGSTR